MGTYVRMTSFRIISVYVIGSLFAVSAPWGSLSVAEAAVLLSDSFGTGSSDNDISGWEESGNDNDSHTRAESAEGSGEDFYSPADGNDNGRFAKIGDDEWMCRSMNSSGHSSMSLKYYWRGDGHGESDDFGIIEYRSSGDCDDSSGWSTLASHALDNSSSSSSDSQEPWSSLQTISLPGALNNDSFWLIRVRNNASQSDEHFRIDGISIETSGDTTAPAVTNVTSSTANGSYNAGDVISVQVSFNETVIVSGTPRVVLETGATDRNANYSSGSNSTTLSFTYTVQAGDTAADLNYVSTSALELNGGTIRDAALNNAVLTLPATGGGNSLGTNKNIVIDTTAPVITEVTPVPALDNDSTPNYTVNASEAGTLSYTGSCVSGTTNVGVGNATLTFALLADGTYAGCSITLTDVAGNSGIVAVTPFTVDTTAPVITILGDNPLELGTGDTFTDPGATALDANDGSVTVVVAHSVNTAVPGTYDVSYGASDAAGNSSVTAIRAVNVSDDDAPVFSGVPSNMNIEAADLSGAVVTYSTPTASDNVDGDVSSSVSCTPNSGTTFPMGTTIVGCSVTDAAGNTASASFSVTVADTTAPVVVTSGDQTIEATGPTGAAATFTVSATDTVSGDVSSTIVCDALSGNTFALGSTLVSCTAEDAAGNVGAASLTITVVDTTAPTIAIDPSSVYISTTNDDASASFSTIESDIVDTNLDVVCSPVSGSVFPIGLTTVTCTATDDSGNSASDSIIVTVEKGQGSGSTDASPFEPQPIVIAEVADVPEMPAPAPQEEAPAEEAAETESEGEVLGASCSILTGYVGMGSYSADDVRFVQEFLNKELGLSLIVSGEYDAETIAAVKAFQTKYATEVLAPWMPFGHDGVTPTGIVFKTTQYWMNKLSCPDLELVAPVLP